MIVSLRPLSVLVAASLCLSSPSVEELAFHAEQGTSVQRTFDYELEMELQSMSMSMNGEELPSEHLEGIEIQILETDHVVVTDHFGPLGDGRPAVLRRSFDELSGESNEDSVGPDGEGEQQSKQKSSDLEGSTVVFTWDDDAEEYTVEFEDGGDEDLLEELEEDMDLRGFLPDGDVDEGDSWEVSIQPFKQLLEVSGNLDLRSDDEERTEIDEQLSDSLDGDVRVTFAGTRDEGGVLVAVLELEISATAEGEGTEETPMGSEAVQRVAMEFELEGELFWALDAGRLHGVELTGSLDAQIHNTSEFEGNGETMEIEQVLIFEGTVSFVVSVEVQ